MITGIAGDIGQGKTLVLTKYVLEEWRQFQKPIYSNYHLRGIPHKYITLEDFMLMVEAEVDLKRAVLALQEIHTWMDSRLSASGMSRALSYFFNQTGKEGINAYYDTQDFGQVDVRLRKRTDVAIYVQRKGNLHFLTLKNMNRDWVKPKRAVVHGPDYYQFYDTTEKARIRKVAQT